MTDSAMAKTKRTKGQAMIYKTLHIQLQIEQHKLRLIGKYNAT